LSPNEQDIADYEARAKEAGKRISECQTLQRQLENKQAVYKAQEQNLRTMEKSIGVVRDTIIT